VQISESPGKGLASPVARDKLCSPPSAAVVGWTGFKDWTAGFMSPWSCEIRVPAGQAPAASCYGLAREIPEKEGPESNQG